MTGTTAPDRPAPGLAAVPVATATVAQLEAFRANLRLSLEVNARTLADVELELAVRAGRERVA